VEKGGWVYIMANRYRGGIYVGVTADLLRRVYQHREGTGSKHVAGFEKHASSMPNDTKKSNRPSRARSSSKNGSANGSSRRSKPKTPIGATCGTFGSKLKPR